MWSPRTVKYRSLIENVQRRATKFILNYPKEMTYTERLITTNLLPLEFRREITDLTLMYKSKTRLIPMDVNNYLGSCDSGFRSPNYNENNFYFLLKNKQQYFRNSFFSDLQVCGTVYTSRSEVMWFAKIFQIQYS